MKGTGGKGFGEVSVELVSVTSSLPPVPRDAAHAATAAAQVGAVDIGLGGAVVVAQVTAVAGVELGQRHSAVGLLVA